MNTLNLFKNADDVEEHPAGAMIFEQDDRRDVREMEIRAHREALSKLGPDDLLGEMTLIDSSPRSASAVALTRCRLVPRG